MLQCLRHLHGPLLDSLQDVHLSLVPGSPEPDTVPQVWHHQCQVERKDHDLSLLAKLLLMQPRTPLVFLVARAHCWLMINLVPTRASRAFPAKLLSSRAARRTCWCLALSLPRCGTLRFPLLNFLGLLPWQGTALG